MKDLVREIQAMETTAVASHIAMVKARDARHKAQAAKLLPSLRCWSVLVFGHERTVLLKKFAIIMQYFLSYEIPYISSGYSL